MHLEGTPAIVVGAGVVVVLAAAGFFMLTNTALVSQQLSSEQSEYSSEIPTTFSPAEARAILDGLRGDGISAKEKSNILAGLRAL